ncbi:hypothetical protein BDW22DRAFT_1487304 [Trametopsis cervina]|nr:hypothetical protein BDW22DRAFT_1487304 [Trametopsis cervina]
MASSDSEQLQFQAHVMADNLLMFNNYTTVAACVTWVLDYLETLPTEVEAFYRTLSTPAPPGRRRLRPRLNKTMWTAALFFTSRYSFLVFVALQMWCTAPGVASDQTCYVVGQALTVFAEVAMACSCTLLVLRAYVLSGHKRLVLATGILLVLCRIGSALYANLILVIDVSGLSAQNDGGSFEPRCSAALAKESQAGLMVRHVELLHRYRVAYTYRASFVVDSLQVLTQCSTLALDTFVFVVVLATTLPHAVNMRRRSQSSVAEIVIRDGVLYYVTITIIAACATAANFQTQNNIHMSAAERRINEFWSVMFPFYNILPNMLVNRLVLNMRTYFARRPAVDVAAEGMVFSAAPSVDR